MLEEVVQGNSLEEIRNEWAFRHNISPHDIKFEVLEKPGLFKHQWKIRLFWEEKSLSNAQIAHSQAIWNESKYTLFIAEGVKRVMPYALVGEVWLNGSLQEKPFLVSSEDQVEFHPFTQAGELTWDLHVRFHGVSAVAKVKHEMPGHYVLPKELPTVEEIVLEKCAIWEEVPPQGEFWDERKLNLDLEKLNVVYGRLPESWANIIAVKGTQEVTVAVASVPVPAVPPQLIEYIGSLEEASDSNEKTVNYFASKLHLISKGAVLARKIPGKQGTNGKDIFGKDILTPSMKDFQFRPKKNVHLSADGLEVIADCAGQPVRVDHLTYLVEDVYVLHKDVDLATGSIEFPGNVMIQGNVQDGLHIFSGGKLEIIGSVSHADIRADKGVKIHQNLVGGKTVVGQTYVVRSELLRSVTALRDQLGMCLVRTNELIQSPGAVNFKPEQCLKIIMEKQFQDLPKLAEHTEKFVLDHKDDEMVTEGLIVSIRTAKHFLIGLGPLELQSFSFLKRVEQAFAQFVENMTIEIPEKLSFVVSYVQGATIECGGSFECQRGSYNSDIRVDGDVVIEGVCRGGKIAAGGNISIRELGGSGVSSTFVQISPTSRLSVNYCHSNIVIAVGKEIIKIEEACRQLVVYREKGRVEVERIRENPL